MPDASGLPARPFDHAVADLALSGLSRPRKTLPAKLFYDEEGCRLFYRITELNEYYLTRTELSLLPRVAEALSETLTPAGVLVEYGASDEGKAAFLLDPRHRAAMQAYVPIDVAMPSLQRMRARLAASHPHLAVYPIAADFMQPVNLPDAVRGLPRLGFFPGSTIGNLDPSEATAFLGSARRTLGTASHFLVGVDLRKDPSTLLPAYDDAAGVTAAFNRNLLVRLNREAAADFDPAAFAHRAVWNDTASRIEMHLVSRSNQTVSIAGSRIRFARGETVHTENSYKYSPGQFEAMAGQAGWECGATWTDPARLFALFLLRPSA